MAKPKFKDPGTIAKSKQKDDGTGDAMMTAGLITTSGSEDFSIGVFVNNAGAKTAVQDPNDSISGNGLAGSIDATSSGFTGVGFTYTYSESGAVSAMYAVLEAVQ
jgi:hypothetical protein|tara:strand:- start:544 stop:858 length:315 start_codon:yes stop_codon:yes gene_type:complete